MSTCPEKDIHSIYLDNELPMAYVKEYEAHIQSCEKCRKQLENLKKIRSIFQKDSESLNCDKTYLDQSFSRLQSRLSFTKVTNISENKKIHPFGVLKFTVPAAAAAAILALIIPLRLQKSPITTNENTLTPILAKQSINPTPVSENNVVVNGNIRHESVSNMFNNAENVSYNSYNNSTSPAQIQVEKMSKALAAVDIFRPEFGDSNTIQIRITIPTPETIPVHIVQAEE